MTGFAVGGFLVVGINVASPAQALVGLSLAVGFLLCTEPAYWSTPMDLGGAYAGTAGGIMNMAGNLGGVVSTAPCRFSSATGWPFAFFRRRLRAGRGGIVAVGPAVPGVASSCLPRTP
jgi:hypothetical protein